MFILTLAPQYFLWHYLNGFEAFLHVWSNLLWGVVHFFSIGNLAKSLFAPWKRITEKPRKKWDFDAIAGALVVNFMSRVIGFLLRLILIFVGTIILLSMIMVGIAALVVWVFAPVVLFGLFGYGVFLTLAGLYAYTF